jgi:SAM-dependent methyltransferase
MVADVQRMAIPELTRIFGQCGLYLRPTSAISPELSGNMVGHVISLHREANQFNGPVRCLDHDLPLTSSSLSLVYGLFMLESSGEPELLMQEVARVLTPEGTALLVGFNPWGPARWRWRLRGAHAGAHGQVDRLAQDAGLEVVRHQFLGAVWPRETTDPADAGRKRGFDRLRVADLAVLRRREAALTPLRKLGHTVGLRPNMSAG